MTKVTVRHMYENKTYQVEEDQVIQWANDLLETKAGYELPLKNLFTMDDWLELCEFLEDEGDVEVYAEYDVTEFLSGEDLELQLEEDYYDYEFE